MKIKGIVLKETLTKESDRVITILTASGIIKAYAKAAKNIKSKKFTATSQFSYSEFVLFEGKDLYIVNDAAEIEIFYNLRNDIETLALSQYFAQLTAATVPETLQSEEILRLLLNSLYFICNKENIYKIKIIFELRLMGELGFMPDITACSECGKYTDDIMFFDIFQSNLICKDCLNDKAEQLYKLSKDQLDTMRYILYSEFNKIFNFNISDESARQLSMITEKYVQFVVDRSFKTLDYFNSIRI